MVHSLELCDWPVLPNFFLNIYSQSLQIDLKICFGVIPEVAIIIKFLESLKVSTKFLKIIFDTEFAN